MNNTTSYIKSKSIMGRNMIGPDELLKVGYLIKESNLFPPVPFPEEKLLNKKDDYLLIYGSDCLSNGKDITIRNLRSKFGRDPDVSEPCFYNQDWYDNEKFIDEKINAGWFLIRKKIYEESRAVQPTKLMKKYKFPSAVYCTYAFFVAWQVLDIKLWYHDYIWCSDTDHNGDQIYVGKYHDVDGVNKNGFSIHRHLALRQCYGCID